MMKILKTEGVKKMHCEKYSFLVIDTNLPLDNPLRFQRNLLEKVKRVVMTTDEELHM